LKFAARDVLKKAAIAAAACIVLLILSAYLFVHFYFQKTFSHELKQTVLRCTEGIEISADGTDWRPLRPGSRLEKAAGIRTPESERSFMSFDGVRLMAHDRTEYEIAGRRAISLKSGEVYVESAVNSRKPLRIALGDALLLSNGSVLRIARNGDACSIGIASGAIDLTMPDRTTHRLAENQTATWKAKGSDLALAQTNVVDPFARMKISATERTKQRFSNPLLPGNRLIIIKS